MKRLLCFFGIHKYPPYPTGSEAIFTMRFCVRCGTDDITLTKSHKQFTKERNNSNGK